MNGSLASPAYQPEGPPALVAPVPQLANVATISDMAAASETSEGHRKFKDPHGLHLAAPAAFWALHVADKSHPQLLNRTINVETVKERLLELGSDSPFRREYVINQIAKFINPYGHGANSPRFHGEALGWFRQNFPLHNNLTDGMALVVFAARWTINVKGQLASCTRIGPFTTSDVDSKLQTLGFLKGERAAVIKILGWVEPRR